MPIWSKILRALGGGDCHRCLNPKAQCRCGGIVLCVHNGPECSHFNRTSPYDWPAGSERDDRPYS